MIADNKKNTVLLHACCAVCLGYPLQKLQALHYDVTVFFYNPNIFPLSEYERRKAEILKYSETQKFKLIIQEENSSVFYNCTKGLENEPEKALRCEKCFDLRLKKTVEFAQKNNIDLYTTTLSVSPHKSFEQIEKTASNLAKIYTPKFLAFNFKKENGFKRTNQIAEKNGFYRQNYCGCEFSLRNKEQIRL